MSYELHFGGYGVLKLFINEQFKNERISRK